jgi:hypothetical protein
LDSIGRRNTFIERSTSQALARVALRARNENERIEATTPRTIRGVPGSARVDLEVQKCFVRRRCCGGWLGGGVIMTVRVIVRRGALLGHVRAMHLDGEPGPVALASKFQ